MKELLIIFCLVLASLGTLILIKHSNNRFFKYFKKLYSNYRFLLFVITSNIYFYVYFIFKTLIYNKMIVNSESAEFIDGSAGGYFVSEGSAKNYFIVSGVFFILVVLCNLSIFTYSLFYKFKNPNVIAMDKNKKTWYYTLGLILTAIIFSFISLMLFVFMMDYNVSY